MVIILNVNTYEETLLNGQTHISVYNSTAHYKIQKFTVPDDHFFNGDNRTVLMIVDFLSVGYVNYKNLVGKAQMIFFLTIHWKEACLNFGIYIIRLD